MLQKSEGVTYTCALPFTPLGVHVYTQKQPIPPLCHGGCVTRSRKPLVYMTQTGGKVPLRWTHRGYLEGSGRCGGVIRLSVFLPFLISVGGSRIHTGAFHLSTRKPTVAPHGPPTVAPHGPPTVHPQPTHGKIRRLGCSVRHGVGCSRGVLGCFGIGLCALGRHDIRYRKHSAPLI